MDVSISAEGYDVTIETVATREGTEVSRRTWREMVPR